MTLKEQLIQRLLNAGYKQEGPDSYRKIFDRREISFTITKHMYKKTYREFPASEGWYFSNKRLTKKNLDELSITS